MSDRDYPITTTVVIDGLEAPATPDELGAGIPTVLDGLSFQWGRSGPVDQPDIGSCTFQMREQLLDGDPVSMLDTVHVGSRVEVWTKAFVPASASEVMRYTGFNGSGTLNTGLWDGTATLGVTVAKRYGRRAAWVSQEGVYSWTGSVAFPPDFFAPEGTQPDAWDQIRRLLPGQEWTMTVTAWAPHGSTVRPTAYAYTSPYRSETPVQCPIVGGAPDIVTDGAWHTMQVTVTLPDTWSDPDGAWIAPGLHFVAMPSPDTWTGSSGSWAAQVGTWIDRQSVGVAQLSLTSVEPTVRNVLAWSGEVTRVLGQADGDNAYLLNVSCSDEAAKLANTTVGDDPWPAETVAARVARIYDLAPIGGTPVNVDAGLTDFQLSYLDVDRQPVLDLLHDIAQSVNGVMWVATHAVSGPYLWMEDPGARQAARQFQVDPVTGETIIINAPVNAAGVISALDVLRDPVQWEQDTDQVITSVDVSWQLQGVDGDGLPTTEAQTVTRTDAAAAQKFGLRNLQRDTELTAELDAATLADQLLAQARATDWMVSGLAIDTRVLTRDIDAIAYTDRLSTVLDLLDGTRRLGHPLVLIDLPAYVPPGAIASAYLEGGTCTWQDWCWQLELTASPSGSQGQSAAWEDFPPEATWDGVAESITWNSAYGAAAPA